MPIEIINNAGSVLLDDSYINLILAVKGSITLTLAPYSMTYVEFTYTSAEPSVMMALELNSIKVGHITSSRTGNVWRFTVWYPSAYVGQVINYYIFTLSSTISDAGGMLQLRNEVGQLTFDSNLKYMRVEGFYAIPSADAAGGVSLATGMVAGRTYALINVVGRFYSHHLLWPPGQGAAPYRFMDAAYVGVNYRSGNNLNSENLVTQQSSGTSDDSNQWTRGAATGRVLIIDVTNF